MGVQLSMKIALPIAESHYTDVIMPTIASQITSLMVVHSTVYSDADQRKHQGSASLAFVWGIHRDRWIPRTKGQLRGKCFHLMTSSCLATASYRRIDTGPRLDRYVFCRLIENWCIWIRLINISWCNCVTMFIMYYRDVTVGAITFLITSLTSVYSTVHSGADQRKHQSSASLAFVRGIHWGPVNSPHEWLVTRKMFPFDNVIMECILSVFHNQVARQSVTYLKIY